MSQLGLRGMYPQVVRLQASTTLTHYVFQASAAHLKMRSLDNTAQVFFNATDAAAGVNYVSVPAPSASHPHGEWEGPAWVPAIWIGTTTGTATIEVVAFLRMA